MCKLYFTQIFSLSISKKIIKNATKAKEMELQKFKYEENMKRDGIKEPGHQENGKQGRCSMLFYTMCVCIQNMHIV
jgi:hypothetical protein